ncbi:hypothetical protein LCGC14_2019630 [marine sediment metagenome]|uniref:Uncharacterized protein n=1 Tax=marine sediment metagenome TaxID=412755 RepID=A0A0F9FKF2_9ZZZZ
MECSGYANEEGVVEIHVSSYDDPNNPDKQKILYIDILEPGEKVTLEWVEGEPR